MAVSEVSIQPRTSLIQCPFAYSKPARRRRGCGARQAAPALLAAGELLAVGAARPGAPASQIRFPDGVLELCRDGSAAKLRMPFRALRALQHATTRIGTDGALPNVRESEQVLEHLMLSTKRPFDAPDQRIGWKNKIDPTMLQEPVDDAGQNRGVCVTGWIFAGDP